MSEPTDGTELESRWHRNEAELNRLQGLTGLSREMFGARIDELETEQDGIKYVLGCDETRRPGSRSWSGMRMGGSVR
jgi:hypothetical protein